MEATNKLEQIRWKSQSKDGQVMLSLAWEVFVLGVAILSIVNVGLGLFLPNPDTQQVVAVMDAIIIVVFAVDLGWRLSVADDRRRYLVYGWGWVDAISIIPLLRIARLLRIVRVTRAMSHMGGPKAALLAFFANRAAGGLLLVLLIALIVLEFGSLAMLWAERGAPDATILTAEDAVWYMIVTMSTVGYGDLAPVTTTGRTVGSLIIIVGVGVFGTLTGFLANAFLSPSQSRADVSGSIDEGEAEVVIEVPATS